MLSELLGVVLDQLDDVLGGCDLVVLFTVRVGHTLHHELGLRILLPHFLDILEGVFDRQLLLSVRTEVRDLLDMVDELEVEDLLDIERRVLLVKVLLHLNSELFPMAVSHRFVPQVLDERDSVSEHTDLVIDVLSDLPLLLRRFEVVELHFDLNCTLIHLGEDLLIRFELLECYLLPFIPFTVPLLLDGPDFGERSIFPLHLGQQGIVAWLQLEDL